jgi:hypothetical protein
LIYIYKNPTIEETTRGAVLEISEEGMLLRVAGRPVAFTFSPGMDSASKKLRSVLEPYDVVTAVVRGSEVSKILEVESKRQINTPEVWPSGWFSCSRCEG